MSAGAYLCICLTRRMAKVEAGKTKSGNEVDIKNKKLKETK